MKTIDISLKYYQNQAICGIISLLYCYGPPYYTAGKSLSQREKQKIENVKERLEVSREETRDTNPDRYLSFPYSDDELNKITIVAVTKTELDLLLVALKETILEYEGEDGYTLKVTTRFDLDTSREILKLLEFYQLNYLKTIGDLKPG